MKDEYVYAFEALVRAHCVLISKQQSIHIFQVVSLQRCSCPSCSSS